MGYHLAVDDTDHAGDRNASQHPLDRIFERYSAREDQGGYAFVLNLERLEEPVHLAVGVELRSATSEEVAELRGAVDYFIPGFGAARTHPWDYRAVVSLVEGGSKISYMRLDEETHRYHLIAYAGSDVTHDVFDASVVASGPELHRGFDIRWGPIYGQAIGRGLAAFVDGAHDDRGFGTMSKRDALDLVAVYPRVAALPWSHPLRIAISEYSSLRTLGHTRLRLLGRFSILESLVVHQPDQNDPHDSIARQLKTKMVLLDRRFARPVGYDQFVQPIGLENLWKTLYGLRSAIAHGNPPTFDKGRFAALKSLENADRLVASAVRSVLRQMLEEEHLLADLRAC